MRKWTLILSLLVLLSCKDKRKITPAIYYWKTKFRPTDYEWQRLNELHCKTMYLHFFDVDWDEAAGRPTPLSPFDMPAKMQKEIDYIPAVFITQDVIRNLRKEDAPSLAKNISMLTESLCAGASIKPKEIQIDCDWTYSTKQQYFSLLDELKKQSFFKGKKLSCTIRLFQVKYRTRSGIPPVDKGMLMCYNMGNMSNPFEENSILNYEEALQYLKIIGDYPLSLDIAFPLFDWPLLFRNNKLEGILRDIRVKELRQVTFLKEEKKNNFTCSTDTLWKGYDLQKGDRIRMEDSEYESIEKLADYTSKKMKNKEMNIAFFHCDSVTLSKYSSHELEKIIDMYR